VINAYVFSGDLTFVILKFGNNNSTIIFCWTLFDNLLNDNVFNKKELQLYKRGEVVYLSVENFVRNVSLFQAAPYHIMRSLLGMLACFKQLLII
jgi:hypothetical protein